MVLSNFQKHVRPMLLQMGNIVVVCAVLLRNQCDLNDLSGMINIKLNLRETAG